MHVVVRWFEAQVQHVIVPGNGSDIRVHAVRAVTFRPCRVDISLSGPQLPPVTFNSTVRIQVGRFHPARPVDTEVLELDQVRNLLAVLAVSQDLLHLVGGWGPVRQCRQLQGVSLALSGTHLKKPVRTRRHLDVLPVRTA